MNNNFIKYFSLSLILALTLVIFANFLAIKAIDSKVQHFVNQELETPLARIKLRCEKEVPRLNKVFFKYRKSFEQCKIYSTNLDLTKEMDAFDYSKYLLIPVLKINYNLLKKSYIVAFDTIVKHNKESELDNYFLSFGDSIVFHVKHNKEKITEVKMHNHGSISLMHKLGIEIATIKDHRTEASFEDNDERLGFAIDLALKFSAFEDFLKFLRENGKKPTIKADNWNDIHFDFEVIFERYAKKEQEELKKQNPEKYRNEKNFYKNLIYNIESMKASHEDYSVELSGNVIKTPRPGMPDLDLLLKIENINKLLEGIQEDLKAAFYNKGEMTLFNEMRPDIVINAFVKTLRDLSILQDRNLELYVKSDSIGTVSIGGVNFFSFQKELLLNFAKLKSEGILEDFGKSNKGELDSRSGSEGSDFQNSGADN